MKSLKDRISEIDKGRFKDMAEAMNITPECEKCHSFNYKVKNAYLCGVTPKCIGATLRDGLKSYILYKLDKISYEEHLKNVGL